MNMQSASAAIANLRGVHKRYAGRNALGGVDLEILPGRVFGLLGPNGAGKTTALRLLLGFTRPTRGQVLLRGIPPQRAAARERVGYLPERARLPEHVRVGHFLALHGRLAGLTGSDLEREIERVTELTGIADRGRERIGDLSKGLAQRVSFSQALLGDPELLLLDEPTSGLDPIGVRDARQWIRAATERGSAVLMSSHVLSEVERTCEDLAILNEGQIVARGAMAELVGESQSLEDVFMRAVQA